MSKELASSIKKGMAAILDLDDHHFFNRATTLTTGPTRPLGISPPHGIPVTKMVPDNYDGTLSIGASLVINQKPSADLLGSVASDVVAPCAEADIVKSMAAILNLNGDHFFRPAKSTGASLEGTPLSQRVSGPNNIKMRPLTTSDSVSFLSSRVDHRQATRRRHALVTVALAASGILAISRSDMTSMANRNRPHFPIARPVRRTSQVSTAKPMRLPPLLAQKLTVARHEVMLTTPLPHSRSDLDSIIIKSSSKPRGTSRGEPTTKIAEVTFREGATRPNPAIDNDQMTRRELNSSINKSAKAYLAPLIASETASNGISNARLADDDVSTASTVSARVISRRRDAIDAIRSLRSH